MIQLIECPRDAMQGLPDFIPTNLKAEYINMLLKVGFHTIDFGSFVSPKAIPQLKDTREVLAKLDLGNTSSKLLAIVANIRGAEEALSFDEIDYLGFPFSLSETFQRRNTNKSIAEAYENVQAMQARCQKKGKDLVVYFSMGFGNPYGDVWNAEIVSHWLEKMKALSIRTVALSDTVGLAAPSAIKALFTDLNSIQGAMNLGVHLHANPKDARAKIDAAFQAGCRRFDSALGGLGGCPMAENDLVGNIATESLITYLDEHTIAHSLNKPAWQEAMAFSSNVFGIQGTANRL